MLYFSLGRGELVMSPGALALNLSHSEQDRSGGFLPKQVM